MPRQKRKASGEGPKRPMMSVNPPRDVTPAVGGYRTVPLTQAIRIVAHMLGEAATRVAPSFSPQEWDVIAKSFQGRTVEPEHPMPGHSLARIVERSHHFYKTGARLGENADQDVANLVARLETLDYLNAWAVIIACQFYWDWQDRLESEPGFKWWDLADRRELLIRSAQPN
jgi:hypothetical protein